MVTSQTNGLPLIIIIIIIITDHLVIYYNNSGHECTSTAGCGYFKSSLLKYRGPCFKLHYAKCTLNRGALQWGSSVFIQTYFETKALHGYIVAAVTSLATSGSGTLRYVETTERLIALLISCRAKCMPSDTAFKNTRNIIITKTKLNIFYRLRMRYKMHISWLSHKQKIENTLLTM